MQIFGTEEDKVNCPFYLKMGACRHGDRCSRIHNRPILSQTLLLQNMYVAPKQEFDAQTGQPIAQDERAIQEHFEDFYEDIFEELNTIGGELEQLRVCENLSDHLSGNVYAKFYEEEDAEAALNKLVVRAARLARTPRRAIPQARASPPGVATRRPHRVHLSSRARGGRRDASTRGNRSSRSSAR